MPTEIPADEPADANDTLAASEPAKTVSYKRIAENASFYMLSQIAGWVISFLTISIIPRALGETAVGELAVLGAAFMPLGTILGCGLESILVKEVGRNPNQAERLLRACIGLRLALHIPGVAASFLALSLIHPSPELWRLGTWSILLGFSGGFLELLRSVQAGWEHAKRVSALDFLPTLTPILVLPFLRYGPMALIIANSTVALSILLVRMAWVRQRISIRPSFDVAAWKLLVMGGLPFVATNFIGAMYAATTTFMLRHYTNDATVGAHAQASRLFGTFLFVPTVIGYAMLPAMSRLAEVNPQEFRRTQSHVLGLLIILGLPVTAMMIFLAAPLCHLLYGPRMFTTLPVALEVFAFALIPMYIVTTMYQFLVAQGRAAIWTLFYMGTVGLYALFSSLLIPLTLRTLHNGVVGAVSATVLAEGCAAISAIMLLKINPFNAEVMNRVGRAFAATLAMSAVMWLTRGWFVLFPALLGIAVFVFLTWRLRVLTPDEQSKVVGYVRQRLNLRQAA